MGVYRIGDIIRYTRKATNLTQEQLAAGICSVESLSRFETGKLTPKNEVFYSLMEKMGRDPVRYTVPVSKSSLEAERIIRDIAFYKERMDYRKVKKLLQELKKSEEFDLKQNRNKQYAEMISLLVEKKEKEITENLYCEKLQECLKITFPEFCEDYPIERMFTKTEINLLNNIANSYADQGKREYAIHLLNRVLLYFDKIQIVNNYEEYGMVLLSLANQLGMCRRHQESITVCEKGIEWLNETGRSNYYYNFLFNIGWNMMMQYEKDRDQKKQKLAKQFVKQAYYFNLICSESKTNLEVIKKYYTETFREIEAGFES